MSETTVAHNKTVPMLLGVVAVLLLAIIVVLVVGNGKDDSASTTDTSAADTNVSAPVSQPGMGASTGVEFDPATATKVAEGVTPEEHVTAYYQAILDKEFDKAFTMQPATSQMGNTAADFEATQLGYGMVSFTIEEATESGDTALVTVRQDLGANGMWAAQWTLVQYEGGWVVQSRAVGMAQ
ncbi:MAG: hypothetical protein Q7J82_08940 [Coriobacteriia bacterium]|nr:hypothetical protein [Coriobacteriia bacterium]